jgi:hypothetical protein
MERNIKEIYRMIHLLPSMPRLESGIESAVDTRSLSSVQLPQNRGVARNGRDDVEEDEVQRLRPEFPARVLARGG